MKNPRRIRVIVLSIALGLSVWGAAFTFTTASFSEGDVLSAEALNTLLNSNFQAAASATDEKLDLSGGTIDGTLRVNGDAPFENGTGALFVSLTDDAGSAGVFRGNTDSGNGVVTIKQGGAAPVLTLKALGSGQIIGGANGTAVRFVVENDGSISIGNLGSDGTSDPTLRLDAEAGTVTNAVGSGLPVAFGFIRSDCDVVEDMSTSNLSAAEALAPNPAGSCNIVIDGGDNHTDYTIIVTPDGAVEALTPSIGFDGTDAINIVFLDDNDVYTAKPFHFVAFKAAP